MQHGLLGSEHSKATREGRSQVGHQAASGPEEHEQSHSGLGSGQNLVPSCPGNVFYSSTFEVSFKSYNEHLSSVYA